MVWCVWVGGWGKGGRGWGAIFCPCDVSGGPHSPTPHPNLHPTFFSQAASVVFHMDTAVDRMEIHAAYARPVAGGHLHATGQMSVAPDAEMDPGAVWIRAQGADLPMDKLIKHYMPGGRGRMGAGSRCMPGGRGRMGAGSRCMPVRMLGDGAPSTLLPL